MGGGKVPNQLGFWPIVKNLVKLFPEDHGHVVKIHFVSFLLRSLPCWCSTFTTDMRLAHVERLPLESHDLR